MGEGVDEVGGAQSPVIVGRFNGRLSGGALGSPIGVSSTATLESNITSFQNAVGGEFAIQNLFKNSPKNYTQATMTAPVLAGSTGGFTADAGFLTNPYSGNFWNGVLITPNSVLGAAFRSLASTEYGLDLGSGSQTVAANKVPSSLGQQSPTIDSQDVAGTAIAASGNALLGAGADGLFVVTNVTPQTTAVYAGEAATGLVPLGGSPGWVAPIKTPATGQASVAFDGTTGIRIYNGYSSSQSFKTIVISTR